MKTRVIAVAILSVVLLALILILGRKGDPFGNKNSSFAIPGDKDITSIIIEPPDGQSLELRKSEEGWLVNGKSEVRESAVSFILTTLHNIQINSPVSDEIFLDEVSVSGKAPVQVKVGGGKGRETGFLIYPATESFTRSVFRRNERSKPFTVTVPGYEGDPGTFFVADPRFWEPYRIFSLHPDSIKSVSVRYLDPQMSSFLLSSAADTWEVSNGKMQSEEAAGDKVGRYIAWFGFVPFETWDFGLTTAEKQSIKEVDAEIVIEVEKISGSTIKLELWTRSLPSENGPVPDTDRLYGSTNNGDDIFIVKYFDIDPLLKSAEYFTNH